MELPVDDLFQPGNPFSVEPWDETETAEPRHIAMVRIPSGRLAVSDPLDEKPRELTERIPPGEYALEAAVIAGEGEYGGDRFPVTEEPAVRLLIRDEPAVAWESALSEGEDPRLLLDGHAYGFSTDAATGSFADAAAWETLSGKVGRHYEEQDDGACESIGNGRIRAVDEATGSDLLSFCTGRRDMAGMARPLRHRRTRLDRGDHVVPLASHHATPWTYGRIRGQAACHQIPRLPRLPRGPPRPVPRTPHP
ncbi:DUF4241 domain-containing protein, partial [Streptomyces sp. NTH33]|uniref:DUF4241 domain-containing protein n=1 Tax=Streptomyces sp. NTH33 TaxID=1735453 RepID=UPI0021ACEA1A